MDTQKSSENIKPARRTKPWQIILVTAIIVGFPFVSLVVNLKGAQKGKAFYGKLQEMGTLPAFNLPDDIAVSKVFTSNDLVRKVGVLSFITPESKDSVLSVLKTIGKLEHFDDAENLNILAFNLSGAGALTDFSTSLTHRERVKWHILEGGQSVQQGLKMSNNFSVALLDSTGVVRQHYDVREPKDRKLLIEHISIMPIRNKRKVEKVEPKSL
jgi:hypothetical protein